MKSPRCLYSLDWVQVFCLRPINQTMEWKEKTSPRSDRWGNHRVYSLTKASEYIHGYRHTACVVWRKYTIATIAWEPADTTHRPEGCAIKLANGVLYCGDWYFILLDLFATLEWEAHNLTRIDLACDLNYFLGGLLPSTFIRNYVSKTTSYIRHGSNKFAVYGRKEMRCTIFDSIRWGSRNSGVSVYLYNKTKELQEIKDKPYIRHAWQEAQLSSTLPVWRVEISITSQGLGLKDIASHMFHTLFVDDVATPEAVRDMFLTYASRYFYFLRLTKEAKRKRDLKELPLLPRMEHPVYMPATMKEYVGAGRMEKIVANKLGDMVEFLHVRDFDGKVAMIESLKKAENLYTEIHAMKRRIHEDETAITNEIGRSLDDVLGVTAMAKYRERLGWARKHMEELKAIAKANAREVVAVNLDKPSTNPASVPLPSTPYGSTEQQKP